MTKLLLIRHGETMFNRERRLQGCKDVPLSDLGARQADACAGYISSFNQGRITAVYSSPLSRAYMTACAIGKAIGSNVVTDDRLKEIDVGALAGMTWDEVELAYPDFMAEHGSDPIGTRYPGGESVADVSARARDLANTFIRDHGNETIVVVGHAIVLKALMCHVLKLEVANHLRLTVGNASLSIASLSRVDGGVHGKILRLNDRHFLEALRIDSPPKKVLEE
jgi:broad specificity phosphatase PhoE